MKIFTVTLNGKDYEVQQGDDGVFSLPESLTHIVGVGTQLKPAIEPIILAQKPLDGTVANNVLAHGVGGLNIDACRVGTKVEGTRTNGSANDVYGDLSYTAGETWEPSAAGRFPANVLLDEHAAKEMDKQSGVRDDRGGVGNKAKDEQDFPSSYSLKGVPKIAYNGSGGASRYFPVFKYQAKAPKKERPVIEREAVYGLRDDLTEDQVDYVLARLREAGVETG